MRTWESDQPTPTPAEVAGQATQTGSTLVEQVVSVQQAVASPAARAEATRELLYLRVTAPEGHVLALESDPDVNRIVREAVTEQGRTCQSRRAAAWRRAPRVLAQVPRTSARRLAELLACCPEMGRFTCGV